MKLLLDIGNSRIKWAVYRAGTLGTQAAIEHRKSLHPQQLEAAWSALPQPKAVMVISVATQQIEDTVSDWLRDKWGLSWTRLVTQSSCAGVINGYLNPQQLGVDRWAAIVAAYQLSRQAVCVIDSGTALTCDAVDGNGQHLGGLIVPGRKLQEQLLLCNTAAISMAETQGEFGNWGQETTSCVKSGILQSELGLVERCIRQLETQTTSEVSVVLTGGDAGALLPYLGPDVRYEPDLVLQGMTYMMMDSRG